MSLILPQRGRLRQPAAAAGGITFVGSAQNKGDVVSSVSVDVSSLSSGTLSEDDVVIVAVAAADNGAAPDYDVTCSGNQSGTATEIFDLWADDNGESSLGVFRITQGATVDTSLTCGVASGTPDSLVAIAFVFRSVDTTTPEDVTSTSSTGINTAIPSGVAITPSTSGAWPVCIAANAHSNALSRTISSSNLTSEVSDNQVTTKVGDTCLCIGYYDSWTSGAFTPTWSWDGTDNNAYAYCVASVALRPA